MKFQGWFVVIESPPEMKWFLVCNGCPWEGRQVPGRLELWLKHDPQI